MSIRKIAIVGAGPVGLELALRARHEGHEVAVFEAATVGEHFRRYGSVRLFTPFHMNSTELGRERLRAAGVKVPGAEEILTAAELRDRYLLPLSRLSELSGTIIEGARVSGIAREGFTKSRSTGGAGGEGAAGSSRASRPFLLRVKERGVPARLERAEVVIDASGLYETPNATGPSGLPASGEETLGDRLERHLPDLAGEARARYAGKHILLIGDGRSAANAIADLDDIVRSGGEGARTRLTWIHRERGSRHFAPVPAAELELLPVLRELDQRVTKIASEAPWIERRPGSSVASYAVLPSGAVEVVLFKPRGGESRIEVDRVLALVGYRPDLWLFRELQIHVCYASEGPMALAAAILAADAKDPGGARGCLEQVPHGPDTLKHPEPDFYVLGAKSYGRNPNFILPLGHQQIEDVMTLLGAAAPRLNVAS